MGLLRHFFNCKDINLNSKYWIYMAGPLNILLWGSESWNLSEQNREKLNAFHHTAIRQILGIWMDEVIKCHIMNEQVQKWFCNIPKVDSFITRRTWKYMGKVYRTKEESLPKKMLGAWVPAPRKAGRPQMSSKDNFIPHSQRSSKQPNQWWSHLQRMVPHSSRRSEMELVDREPLPKIMRRRLTRWWSPKLWVRTLR